MARTRSSMGPDDSSSPAELKRTASQKSSSSAAGVKRTASTKSSSPPAAKRPRGRPPKKEKTQTTIEDSMQGVGYDQDVEKQIKGDGKKTSIEDNMQGIEDDKDVEKQINCQEESGKDESKDFLSFPHSLQPVWDIPVDWA